MNCGGCQGGPLLISGDACLGTLALSPWHPWYAKHAGHRELPN